VLPAEVIRHTAGEYVVGSIHTNSWPRTIFLLGFLSACERFGREYEIKFDLDQLETGARAVALTFGLRRPTGSRIAPAR
jgi:hypothetical protein